MLRRFRAWYRRKRYPRNIVSVDLRGSATQRQAVRMTLEGIVKVMAQHSDDNPRHGYNCSCKDEWLRLGRKIYLNMNDNERRNLHYLISAFRWGE
jgi:hypothetical protein